MNIKEQLFLKGCPFFNPQFEARKPQTVKLCGICSENETWSVVFKSIQIFSLGLKLLHKMPKKSDFKCTEQLLH